MEKHLKKAEKIKSGLNLNLKSKEDSSIWSGPSSNGIEANENRFLKKNLYFFSHKKKY